MLAAFQSVCAKSKRTPEQFWCDEGKEFRNKELTTWRENNGTGMYHTHGCGKSGLVERFNRTLSTVIWRRATADTHEREAVLPLLIMKYNKTVHFQACGKPKQTEARKQDTHDDARP